MKTSLTYADGFSLIEVVVVIVVLGILAAVALQSMTASVDDIRRAETEREMEMLTHAIAGNPALYTAGARCDFGYIGDIGAFPPNLRALYANPGGFATWNGPYLPPGFVQDTSGYRLDAWGEPYQYSGGLTIASTGSGDVITRKVASASADYLSNSLSGVIRDVNDSIPGNKFMDSVDIVISVPDGLGGTTSRFASPDSSGAFTLTSLPVGTHPLRAVYLPTADTLLRYVTVLPRHRNDPPQQLRFISAHFSSATDPCSQPVILRPMGPGSLTELTGDGCSLNWQCVDEIVPDEDASCVESSSTVYLLDLYQMDDPIDTACGTASVTLHFRARRFVKDAFGKAVIRTGGALFEGPEESLVDDYSEYTVQWITNPNTGSPWTWPEITDIEIGVGLRTTKATHPPRCTQVWLTVERTP